MVRRWRRMRPCIRSRGVIPGLVQLHDLDVRSYMATTEANGCNTGEPNSLSVAMPTRTRQAA